jgi:exodeoxyribonuclease VII small subunit
MGGDHMPKTPQKTFEESLRRLEEIVQYLEGNSTSLDESLALYEEGKELVSFCMTKLEAAEQKLKVLSAPHES